MRKSGERSSSPPRTDPPAAGAGTDQADQLRRKTEQLQLLSEVVRTVNSLLEPDAVVASIMDRIQRITRAEAWSLLLVDPTGRELSFKEALGHKADALRDIRIPVGTGIAGTVASTGLPMVVNDTAACPQFNPEPDRLTRFVTRSILAAPLKHQDRVLGVLEVVNHKDGPFSDEDLETVQLFLEPAAIALQNALLFEKVQHLTMVDDLTQLYNSRYLYQALGHELGMGRRYGFPVAVLFLDLDGFKLVNDTNGHLCGSTTLKVVGEILKREVRTVDIVARYGGDEFTLILPNTGREGAVIVAERLRRSIEEFDYAPRLGVPIRLSASFGVALFPDHGDQPQELVQKADTAMYAVKEATKNAVAVYSEE